jgi:hypothetical protein
MSRVWFQVKQNFSLCHKFRVSSGAHITLYSGSSLGIKRPGRKADHAPQSSVMLKMCATTLMPPYIPTRRGASLNTVGQLCHDLVCSLLCLVGKIILTSCQPVLPEMKRATDTGLQEYVRCAVIEGLGFNSLFWDRNPERTLRGFSQPSQELRDIY